MFVLYLYISVSIFLRICMTIFLDISNMKNVVKKFKCTSPRLRKKFPLSNSNTNPFINKYLYKALICLIPTMYRLYFGYKKL